MTSESECSPRNFFERSVRDTLETLCCPSLQFMWDNSLLAPREDLDTDSDEDPPRWYARTLIGFRVVRNFGFMKRDQVLYRCPFCDAELVSPLGYFHEERWMNIDLVRIGKGIVRLDFPRSHLEQWLREAKARSPAFWPPKG